MNIVKQCKTLFGRSSCKLDDEVSSCDRETIPTNGKGVVGQTPAPGTTEAVVNSFLINLQHRFHHYHLASNHDHQDSAFWASVWITEEAIVQANHVEALASLSSSSSSSSCSTTISSSCSTRILSYLKNRKDRTLDFVWSVCRDGPILEQDEVEQLVEDFVRREARLLKIYLVSYIKCDHPSLVCISRIE